MVHVSLHESSCGPLICALEDFETSRYNPRSNSRFSRVRCERKSIFITRIGAGQAKTDGSSKIFPTSMGPECPPMSSNVFRRGESSTDRSITVALSQKQPAALTRLGSNARLERCSSKCCSAVDWRQYGTSCCFLRESYVDENWIIQFTSTQSAQI